MADIADLLARLMHAELEVDRTHVAYREALEKRNRLADMAVRQWKDAHPQPQAKTEVAA